MSKKNKPKDEALNKEDIIKGLIDIGVKPGMVLEVHSSLSSFGYVIGGAQTVVDALLECVTSEGTLLMPMHIPSNSEPARWECPSVEPYLVKKVRDSIPAFDINNSDTEYMGALVENFRRRSGIVISNHPNVPFIALGKHAQFLCNHQSLHFPLSSESPIARIYELKGCCLLVGVDYDRCTSMHLSEYAVDARPIIIEGAAIKRNGRRIWKKYINIDLDSSDFIRVGKRLEALGRVNVTKIGSSQVKLFEVCDAVDEATRYFEKESDYDKYR